MFIFKAILGGQKKFPTLGYTYRKLETIPLLKEAIKRNYRMFPVSYTNMGRINHQKLIFEGCQIENCYMTGTYRLPPDFQLSISTFHNICTLNCTLIGQPGDDKISQYVLEQVRKELLDWVYKN